MSARDNAGTVLKEIGSSLPLDRLKDEAKNALDAAGDKAVSTASDKVKDVTGSLNGIADGGGVVGKAAKGGAAAADQGDSPVKGALAGGMKGVKDKVVSTFTGGGNDPSHSVNIIESVEVGVPVDVAYNQWTQFHEQSDYMRKVENVDTPEDTEVEYTAKILWSTRTWTATVIEQIPDTHIVWRSEGEKGHVDGTVSFHELAPRLTKVIVVLEYYPKGFFEKTGNIWRAQGRRARSDLRHFARHVMTRSILEQDDLEGWRGEIRDEEVQRTPEEVAEDEAQETEGGEAPTDEAPADEESPDEEYSDEPEGEPVEEPEGEPEDEYGEEDPDEEYAEEPEDEPLDEDEEYAEEEPAEDEEYVEEDEEPLDEEEGRG